MATALTGRRATVAVAAVAVVDVVVVTALRGIIIGRSTLS